MHEGVFWTTWATPHSRDCVPVSAARALLSPTLRGGQGRWAEAACARSREQETAELGGERRWRDRAP